MQKIFSTYGMKAALNIRRCCLHFLLAVIILVAGAGCKKEKQPTAVELRILNAAPAAFIDCTIYPPADSIFNFGQVAAGERTAYKTFSLLYSYCGINLTMNSKPYALVIYDYVTELPLAGGKYTYKLTYNSTDDRLGLELLKD